MSWEQLDKYGPYGQFLFAGWLISQMLYRFGRAVLKEVWKPCRVRWFDFLSHLEEFMDAVKDRNRNSDSWRRQNIERMDRIEVKVNKVEEECGKLSLHLLPPMPTAMKRQQQPKKADPPDAT